MHLNINSKAIRSRSVLLLIGLFVFAATSINAQSRPLVPQAADTVLAIWKDYPGATPGRPSRWSYEQGVVLKGMEYAWKQTGDQKYFDYIRQIMDLYVNPDGTVTQPPVNGT
jgi:unsaturated rhamnogalacturonyl hydrolase